MKWNWKSENIKFWHNPVIPVYLIQALWINFILYFLQFSYWLFLLVLSLYSTYNIHFSFCCFLDSFSALKYLQHLENTQTISMGQIELTSVLMQNWVVWNETVYMYEIDLELNNLYGWYATKPNQTKLNQNNKKSFKLIVFRQTIQRKIWNNPMIL